MPPPNKAERVLRNVVAAHRVNTVLWDVDGTLVPGEGLPESCDLVEHVENRDRLQRVIAELAAVEHVVASRNAAFEHETDETGKWMVTLGFSGHLLDLRRKIDVAKQAVAAGARALLIDDQKNECANALRHPSVVAALHVKGNRGLFTELDSGNFQIMS